MKFRRFFVTFLILIGLLGKADALFGKESFSPIQKSYFVKRGEAVSKILHAFDIPTQKKSFFSQCLQKPDECFFVFSTMSRFDGIQFQPLLLYPDVSGAYRYAKEVNMATMLGLVHGYIHEKNTPFRPHHFIRRIDALKVLLEASSLVEWKERFELTSSDAALTPFLDIQSSNALAWWYPRYVHFALSAGIIEPGEFFKPDAPITQAEFENMIQRTLKKVSSLSHDSKIHSSGNSAE